MSIMAVTAAATSIKVEYGRTKTTKHATTYLHGTNTHTVQVARRTSRKLTCWTIYIISERRRWMVAELPSSSSRWMAWCRPGGCLLLLVYRYSKRFGEMIKSCYPLIRLVSPTAKILLLLQVDHDKHNNLHVNFALLLQLILLYHLTQAITVSIIRCCIGP